MTRIGRHFGVKQPAVSDWFRLRRIRVLGAVERAIRRRGMRGSLGSVLGRWLHAQGRTCAWIARRLGVSFRAAADALNRLGLRRLSRRGAAMARRGTRRPPAGLLRRLYLKERRSALEIARRARADVGWVREWLRAAGVRLRTVVESRHSQFGIRRPPDAALRRMYVEKKLSQQQIAARLGTTQSSVRRWMAQAGLPSRPIGEAISLRVLGDRRPTPDQLREMYVDRKMSTVDIGRKVGVAPSVACLWLKRAGIPRRPRSVAVSLAIRKR